MPLVIYNDMKNKEWLDHNKTFPAGTIIIINNETYSSIVRQRLESYGYKVYYSEKLCEGEPVGVMALDAENYRYDKGEPIKYSRELGDRFRGIDVLFPENLGGDKYIGYDKFLIGADPQRVLIERSYSCWYPWDLKRAWDNNEYLRNTGTQTFLGIWIENIPLILRAIQSYYANKISGGNLFYYSETKRLPKKVLWGWM